jgi:hypothetical protein
MYSFFCKEMYCVPELSMAEIFCAVIVPYEMYHKKCIECPVILKLRYISAYCVCF